MTSNPENSSRQYFYLNRRALNEALEQLAAAQHPQQDLNAWLKAVLVSNNTELQQGQEGLVNAVVFRLASVDDHAEAQLKLARDLHTLLSSELSDAEVELLLPLAGSRAECAEVLRRVSGGTISRTGFLSHVANRQTWSQQLKRSFVACSVSELKQLATALDSWDVANIAGFLAK